MPEIRGQGGSLAAAFRNAVASVSLGKPRESYQAKGWHAQVRQLMGTDKGYQAMGDAGAHATRRTLAGWLAQDHAPNKANRAAIDRAYRAMQRGGLPEWVKRADMKITGRVKTGPDERDRGSDGNAPLLVDLSAGNRSRLKHGEPERSHWDVIDDALAGDVDDDDLDEMLSDLIAEDIPPSDIWEFPGGNYSVSISG
jgi:hypothetical protein